MLNDASENVVIFISSVLSAARNTIRASNCFNSFSDLFISINVPTVNFEMCYCIIDPRREAYGMVALPADMSSPGSFL